MLTGIQDYRAHLEQYFEENAYPNLSEIQSLANSSGMTVRQITVWVSHPIPLSPSCLTPTHVVSKPT
jgi:hypothetical protein